MWWIALLLCLAGILLLAWGRRQRNATGLPEGEIVYSDTGDWEKPEKPLVSRRYGLIGRPDYLVRTLEVDKTFTIPVEVKSRRRPPSPYASHVLQLMAYCLLVEDQVGTRPPYGLLRYADTTVRIPYTDDLRKQVLAAAEKIRGARRASQVARQHEDAQRCRACGYRSSCGKEALDQG